MNNKSSLTKAPKHPAETMPVDQRVEGNGHDAEGNFDQFVHYDADPTEAFAKHFEKLGHGIGPAEEMLKTGQDTIELIVRSRTKTENIGAMITLLLKADCDEMIASTGKLSRAIYSRMAGVYALAFSIGENGGARREFVQITAAERRMMDGEAERQRRGFFNRGRGF